MIGRGASTNTLESSRPRVDFRGGWRFAFSFGVVVLWAAVASAQTPVAVDDVFNAPSGELLEVEAPGVLDNDHDGGEEPPAPASAVAHLVSGVDNGALLLNDDGSFTYTSAPGFVGVDTFTYFFVDGTETSNTATVSITVEGCEPGVAPTQWVCWIEQAYLARAVELGLSAFVEGFESDAEWGGARTSDALPSVVSQGITWTSNFAANEITTGNGVLHTGNWGVFSSPHGDQSGLPADLIHDGFIGTAASPDSLLGVGGWLKAGQIGSRIDLIVTYAGGGTTTAAFPDHRLSIEHEFFGFIDTAGFTSFEVVETDGTVNQPYFVFADDFSFLASGADTIPPRVVEIGTFEDTGDGVLSEGETTGVAVTKLMVRFSEPVRDVVGDTDPHDATNPANYLLFEDGGDGFDTVDCAGGVAGGDNPIPLTVLSYAGGDPSEAILVVNDGIALSNAAYRLLVCGTTSIHDWAGSPLDGDGNGIGGDDFNRNFVVAAIANRPPVADAQSVVTAEDTPLGITLTGSDPDGDPIEFYLATLPSNGSLSGVVPNLIYTPDPDFFGPDDFSFEVEDDEFLISDPTTVSITVNPVNDAPIADAGSDQNLIVSSTATLDGSRSYDGDEDPLIYAWSLTSVPVGSTAALSSSTALMPTFTVDLPGSYLVQLVVNDGAVNSAPDTVTISTDNSAPVAAAGPDQNVLVTDTVTLDGSGSSDGDGDALTYAWSFTSVPMGSAATLSSLTALAPTFVVDLPGSYVVQLVVNDGTVDSAPDTVVISTDNSAPAAAAGPDQSVLVTDTVTLDGSGSSDVDSDALTYAWSFTSVPMGSTATLSSLTALAPTFVVDLPGSYVVQLVVNDGTVDSAPDTVTISTSNSAPVAAAGPDQTALVAAAVMLDGGGSSDVDGDALTFAWSFTSVPMGSTAMLSSSTALMPTFAVDLPGSYVVQLLVNDGTVDSAPDTVTIGTDNSAPVADAGPDQSALVTDTVTLDGGGSMDVDGDSLTYAWSVASVPVGSTATLSNSTALMPTFTLDQPGFYVVQLVVNDGTVNSAPDTVIISTDNSAPVAAAGPDQSVLVTETVMLDGSGSSDVDGDALTYAWSFTSVPVGSAATLSSSTALMPTFDVDQSGAYVIQLVVNDGTVNSAPDTVTINTDNSAPVADPQSVSTPEDVALGITLTGSDVDGDVLTFTIGTGPIHGFLIGTSPDLTYISGADYSGPDSFTYTIHDGFLISPVATVSISVTPVNDRPHAAAGPDQDVLVTDTVTLDGGGSMDVDGDALTYAWSFTSVPVGSTATLSSFTELTPTFTADQPGSYVVQLVVNDGTVDSAPDSVIISTDNSAPVADPQAVATPEDTAVEITLTGSDVDGDTLSFSIETGPIHGALTGTPPDVTYTPVADYNGPDSFGFTARDGVLTSTPAVVAITVTPAADPVLTMGDASLSEPDAGSVNVSVTIGVSEPSPVAITVDFETADGTASAGFDYVAAVGSAVIPALALSHDLEIEIIGELTDEPDETFSIVLSNPAIGAPVTGTVTIIDNDPMPELSATGAIVGEAAGIAGISLDLDRASGFSVSVDYLTVDDSAVSPGDYTAVGGTATIAQGATSAVISVPVVNDSEIEAGESFSIELSLPENTVLLTPSVTVTIIDDDGCNIAGDADGNCGLDAADAALIIAILDDPGHPALGDPDCTLDGIIDETDVVCVVQVITAQ